MKQKSFCQGRFRSLIKNENGIVLPVTLLLFFLFTTLTFHAAIKLETEKQYFKNIETTYTLETMLHSAYKDVKQLFNEGKDELEGKLFYHSGFVIYKVVQEEENGALVSFECRTDNGGKFYTELFIEADQEETK